MKISIVTATLNSAETVRDTFDSVLRQEYKDYELVVVDGGSKDETVAIIQEYEPKFEGRMRLWSEPDKGLYDAMNKGISRATGDVVGILNSDDFYTSFDVLQAVANAFAKHPDIDAVYDDIHYVKQDDLTELVRYYSSKSFRRCWMRAGFMPAHPSFYCKKSVYDRFKLDCHKIEGFKAWATEGHSVAIPGLGTMRFAVNATSVADVNKVASSLITSRKVLFTPSVDIKNELKATAISITCYDRNGEIVKRVTSADDGEVEDPENPNPDGGDNPSDGQQSTDNGQQTGGNQQTGGGSQQTGDNTQGTGTNTGSGTDQGGADDNNPPVFG